MHKRQQILRTILATTISSLVLTGCNDKGVRIVVGTGDQQVTPTVTSTINPTVSPTAILTSSPPVTPTLVSTEAPTATPTNIITPTLTPALSPSPTQPLDNMCAGFNAYPNWTQGDHALQGDIMVWQDVAFKANFTTQSVPGTAPDWQWYLNCEGSIGPVEAISMPNPQDPLSLRLQGWPNHLVVALPSDSTTNVKAMNLSKEAELSSVEVVQTSFEALINTVMNAQGASIVLRSNVLDAEYDNSSAVSVKQALAAAAFNTSVELNNIDSLTDDVIGWARAHNLIMDQLAPDVVFGWQVNIGDFAFEQHSGYQAIWSSASRSRVYSLNRLGIYLGAEAADFIAFAKPSNTAAFTSVQWDNALRFVKQVSDYANVPAMLSSVPSGQAGNYLLGATSAESKLRHAAAHNVFAVLFETDDAVLSTKIADYEQNPVPLYHGGSGLNSTLIGNEELDASLLHVANTMNNQVLLYQVNPVGDLWSPSDIYHWQDFLSALRVMHNQGVAGDKFWLFDQDVDHASNEQYAKVAIAAFVAQAMQDSIRLNTCDESNISLTNNGAPTDFPLSAACGQFGQVYGDYGVNPFTGLDHPYSCARNSKMEITATTNPGYYGAPAPLFTAPNSVLEEAGILLNGAVGRWSAQQGWCGDSSPTVDQSKQAWLRSECEVYAGQKAGVFIHDGSSQQSVEGCGWWGRGALLATGRQDFGTLNHFLGRSHVDPTLVGTTIDGQLVGSAPADPLYANMDFCANPQLICSSQDNPELKWIAGLFTYMRAVQNYTGAGTYADWQYVDQLKAYVDGGLAGTQFIDAVSGLVNKGCPDSTCPITGDVDGLQERRDNFKLVLQTLGLNPR